MTRLPEQFIGLYPETECNEFTVEHNLGCKDAVVKFYDAETGKELFLSYWVIDYTHIDVTSAHFYLVNGNVRFVEGEPFKPQSVRVVIVG